MPAIRSKDWPLAPRERGWDADAAEDRIRRWAGGPDKEEMDWGKYRSCFMWYDSDDPENFTSYKFPYVDVINGEPHVVFRALAAIIAVLNGARGGTNIPDREAVYREAARQYRRFDEEPPELQRGMPEDDLERRVVNGQMEVRELEGRGPLIIGYAAVYNNLSDDLGGFYEMVLPGAFDEALKPGADVRALWQHDPAMVLGRTTNGTLRLQSDERGLRFEIDPPPTSWANDALVSMRRGDVNQMSFGFYVPDGGDEWRSAGGMLVRMIHRLRLLEISPVTFAAYPATTVSVRAALRARGGADPVEALRAQAEYRERVLKLAML